MGIEAYYLKRIGVQARAWASVRSPTPLTTGGLGSDVADAGPRASRTLRAARDPQFLEPRLAGLPRGSTWCESESELTYRINEAAFWLGSLKSLPDSDLLSVERDLAEKAILQVGAAAGWDIFPQGIGMKGGAPIEAAAIAVGEWLEATFPKLEPRTTTVPRGTNSGAPTYGTSDLDKLLHALMAAEVTAGGGDFERVYAAYAGAFEAIPEPHALLFSRTGPVRKALDFYDWVGSTMGKVAEGISVAPRRRAVFGVPAFINMTILPYANIIKYMVMRMPWTAHPSEFIVYGDMEADRAGVGRGAFTFSDDISGFDQHVRAHHQAAIADHIYARFWPGWVVDMWKRAQRLPVLAPPLNANQRGFLYRRPNGGMTTSGIITTTLDGTLINMCRAITSLASVEGRSPKDQFKRLIARKWGFRGWGDDTVMTVQPGTDMAKYQAANEELGYKTAAVPGATFLMKHYDLYARTVYPLATRMLQQTFWNEKGGRSPEIELLGLFVRTAGLFANPLGRDVWQLLISGPSTAQRYGVRTREQLGSIIADPGFRDALITSVKANRSTVADWLARSERGHEEDAALLAWISPYLGGPIEDLAALDLSSAIETPAPQASTRGHQLARYLATPKEDRLSTAPDWVTTLLNTQPPTSGGSNDDDQTSS